MYIVPREPGIKYIPNHKKIEFHIKQNKLTFVLD